MRRVRVIFETAQTSGVVLENSTARFEVAEAAKLVGAAPKTRLGRDAKIIDCGAGAMVNVWPTGAAAE